MSAGLMGPSLSHSFAIQCRVIYALILREMITRYGRHGIGMLWLIAEPMLFTLGVAALWSFARMHTLSNVPIIAFAITGYSSILLWRNVANRCTHAIEVNVGLMYHRNVKVIDVFLSRAFLEVIGASASFMLLTVFFSAIGEMKWPIDFAILMGGWILLSWFAVALGFIVGAISERSEVFDRLWHVATYLLFPLSGAAFMVHWLPRQAQDFILWLPMVHGVEMIRHGFFGNVTPTYEDPVYLVLVNLIMSLLGLALVQETGRRIQPE